MPTTCKHAAESGPEGEAIPERRGHPALRSRGVSGRATTCLFEAPAAADRRFVFQMHTCCPYEPSAGGEAWTGRPGKWLRQWSLTADAPRGTIVGAGPKPGARTPFWCSEAEVGPSKPQPTGQGPERGRHRGCRLGWAQSNEGPSEQQGRGSRASWVGGSPGLKTRSLTMTFYLTPRKRSRC